MNTGSFDDFETLIPIARQYGAWVHVDGAFGMWAAASPRFEHLVRGLERAHSWATDGHKWLNVPYDCGYAFVAEPKAHRASMSSQASYLTQGGLARDPMDWNPEFSRRARGFATYAALRELGRTGVRELVERCCDCAAQLVAGLGELEGVKVLRRPDHQPGTRHFSRSIGRSVQRVDRQGYRRDCSRGDRILLRNNFERTARPCASASATGKPHPKT